jgi:hypothetical protein
MIGLKRAEVTRGWRKLRNNGLHDLCFVLNIVRGWAEKGMVESLLFECLLQEDEMMCV